MTDEFLGKRRSALEEAFFKKRNTELLERLRRESVLESKRNEFARVSGISDVKLLDRLIHLKMETETVAAISLVPLVQVAWADGDLAQQEREAILKAAVESGMHVDDPSYHWLISWLDVKPDTKLITAWKEYVTALVATLSPADREALRDGLLGRAKAVAQAAGGFLGLGSKVSPEELAVMDDLQRTFA
jgi:hypothetical protein